MPTPHVIVVGSINMDLVIRAQRLPLPGETVLGGDFYQASGGKGANQAVAAARVGREPVAFVAAVGDDVFGRDLLEQLGRENLDLAAVKVVPGMATGVAQIVVDASGENAIAVASGANAQLSPEDIDALPQSLFDHARVLLACLEIPLATVARALERAKRAGLTTILNPAPASGLCNRLDFFKLVDVLTPNEIEAAQLTHSESDGNEPSALAGRLRQQGVGQCIITLGGEGCLVVGEQAEAIPAVRIHAVDTTAAGDAFNGVLAVALAEGRSLIEAARWANRAAAIAVTRNGAQPSLPYRHELETAPA